MNYLFVLCLNQFQNRRMKWKRSRKAQQESKNKDSHGNSSSSEEKIVKDRATPAQPKFKNESTAKTLISLSNGNNFHYPKSIDQSSLSPNSYPAMSSHPQYFTNLPPEIDLGIDENHPNNQSSRQLSSQEYFKSNQFTEHSTNSQQTPKILIQS